jgi:micrococcal nuclease
MKLFSLKSAGLLLTLLLLAITFRYELNAESKSQPLIHYFKPVSAICTRTVDGDTIIVNIAGVKERVRLIGVDTPETKHPRKPVQYFGKEASMFIANTVEGKKVRLEFDQNQRDKYKRLLAYVYLEDGTFLNAEIIKKGYGHAYTKFPFKYMNEFREYEMEARVRKRGLWK